MKKFFLTAIIFSFILSFIPLQTLAAVNDAELQPYLNQLGWSKEELNAYMEENYEMSMADFESFKELNEFLGDVLSEDSLNQILKDNNLTIEELKSKLIEYGDMEENEEIIEVFPFYDDLAGLVKYYGEMTPITEENISSLLMELEITKEELEKLLADNGESLKDYRFIEELQWSVKLYKDNASKTPISETELTKLLKKYNLTEAELDSLLLENEDSLDNYNYIEDLDASLDFYINYSDFVMPELSDLGITEEELGRLMAYFESFNMEDPAFLEKVSALEEKYAFLQEWDIENTEDLSEEQLSQVNELYFDIMNLLNIELKFALSKDGVIKPISFNELLGMESTNGADFIIEIYTITGELLVDMLIPYELMAQYESKGNPADAVVEEVQDEVIQVANFIQKSNGGKTVDGAKLPKTATNMGLNMFLGLIMIVVGAIIFRKFAVKGA